MRSHAVAEKFAGALASGVVGLSAFAGIGAATMAAAPQAAAAGGCSGPTGVTVIVEFPTGTATGCGQAGTALNALRTAGFTTAGHVKYGDAFLCGINGFPAPTPCPVTPPVTAYWSEWIAKRGGNWFYAQLGVTSQQMANGEALAFHFGGTVTPKTPVPAPFPSASSKASAASKPAASSSAPKPAAAAKSTATASKSSATSKSTASTSKSSATSKSTASAPKASTTAPAAKSAAPTKSSSAAQPTSKSAAKAPASNTSGTPTASSTSAPGAPGARSTTSSAPVLPVPVVKASQSVKEGNQQKVVVTYSDGSKVTLAPSQAKDSTYKVGAAKPAAPGASTSEPMAKYSTQVPTPKSSTPHPSISTSGVVPMPTPASTPSGHSNLPGVLAGGGVAAALAVGGAFVARRRG